jgi:hypothetical protein
MLAMIAMLISGLNMIRWLHTDRQWTQEVRVILAMSLTVADLVPATQAGQLLRSVLPVVISHPHFLRRIIPALFHVW